MSGGRAERVEARLAEAEVDLLLVTDLTNVRYLTGFTGSNGLVVTSSRSTSASARRASTRSARPPLTAGAP